jgi:phosphoadenosine phosphosulfate reductase
MGIISSEKIDKAIKLLIKAESLALQYQKYGFCLAFSGGKDSVVIKELAKMSGVKYKTFQNITTLDYPQLMRFVRDNYDDVNFIHPEINFYNLIIKKKMLPTRKARYCCQYLKETSGAGTVIVLGIRHEESSKRALRNELEISGHKYSNSLDQFNIDQETITSCIKGKDKIMLSPILNWSTSDVWNFIRSRKLEYCELYSQGYSRIGCMFCPLSSAKMKYLDRKNYPKVEKQIKLSIAELVKNGFGDQLKGDVNNIFNWWVQNNPKISSMKNFLIDKETNKPMF